MENNFKVYITNKKELDSVFDSGNIHKTLYSIIYNNFALKDSIMCTVIISGKYMFSIKAIKQNVLFYEFEEVFGTEQ